MRVLYLSNGTSSHDRLFLDGLVDAGHEPVLLTYAATGEPLRRDGLETLHRRFTRSQALNLTLAVPDARRVARTTDPDVVHSGYLSTYGLLGALSGRRPHLSMPWGSDVLLETATRRGRAVARFVLRRADAATVDADAVRDRLVEVTGFPSEKVVVFPWGIDLARFRPGRDLAFRESLRLRAEDEVVLCTRSFEPVYGHDVLLRAFARLAATRPAARLVLVGSGSLAGDVRASARALGLEDRVRFPGRLSQEDLSRAYRAADVYVSASHSDGTSVSLLEAMATALPAVVTDLPTNREWIRAEESGLLVPSSDDAALASALERALGDRAAASAWGKRALAVAEARADWAANFRRYEGLLRSLAER